jgi:hypothetical protein
MYVAVRRYEGVTDPQRVAQVAEEDFVPIISELPGFVAHYTLDAGDGVMVGISVFEHKDSEEQSTYRAGELVGEHLQRRAKMLVSYARRAISTQQSAHWLPTAES